MPRTCENVMVLSVLWLLIAGLFLLISPAWGRAAGGTHARRPPRTITIHGRPRDEEFRRRVQRDQGVIVKFGL